MNPCFVTQLVVIVAAGTRKALHQLHQHPEVQTLSTTAEGGTGAGLRPSASCAGAVATEMPTAERRRPMLSVVRRAWWGQGTWLTVKFKNKEASQGPELVNLTLRERSAEANLPEGVWAALTVLGAAWC